MPMDRHAPIATSRRTLLVGAAVTLVATPLAAQDSAAGKVESLRGEAFAEGTSPRRTLQPAADVFSAIWSRPTPAPASIMHLGKATIVKLGALARFRIDKYVIDAGGTLDLEQGPLVLDRNDNAKKENLQVRSPFGLIAVRGTTFFAGPSNDVFGVFVAHGEVSVTGGGPDRNPPRRPRHRHRQAGRRADGAQDLGARAHPGGAGVGGSDMLVLPRSRGEGNEHRAMSDRFRRRSSRGPQPATVNTSTAALRPRTGMVPSFSISFASSLAAAVAPMQIEVFSSLFMPSRREAVFTTLPSAV